MCRSGQLSFGHDLFRSVKFTHILHLPFAFSTMNMLANHSGQQTSLMKSTSSSLCTSLAMVLFLSWANTLFFYWTNKKDRHTLSLCTMVLGLIYSMSSWLQAKLSQLFFRKRASSLRTKGLAYVPIRVVRPGMLSSKETSSGLSWALLLLFSLQCSAPVNDHQFLIWRYNIRGWPSSPLVPPLFRTLLGTLLASGMWTQLPSMR